MDGLATKDKNWSFLILRFQTSKHRSIGVNALIQNFTFNLLLPGFGWLCFLTIGAQLFNFSKFLKVKHMHELERTEGGLFLPRF